MGSQTIARPVIDPFDRGNNRSRTTSYTTTCNKRTLVLQVGDGGDDDVRPQVCRVDRASEGGFARGEAALEGATGSAYAGQVLRIEFQNEFLVALLAAADSGGEERVVGATPDLVTVLDDVGEPVSTELLSAGSFRDDVMRVLPCRYGLHVFVLVLPAHPLLKTAKALEVVGLEAFGYKKYASYTPLATEEGLATVDESVWSVDT
eukprot:1195251-Prorocentrum_minimum.AAC.10